MRLLSVLLVLPLLAGCATEVDLQQTAWTQANAGITACNSQPFKTWTEFALCRQSAITTAYSKTGSSDIAQWLEIQDVAIAQRVDAGQMKPEDAVAQYNADVQQAVQRLSLRAQADLTRREIMASALFNASQNYQRAAQPPPQINCTSNTYSGTTYTNCH